MKIIVDIQHPAHVHYFKYFIEEMEKKGHQILVTASDKDISKILLDLYNMPYILLGSYGKGIIRKAINIPIMDYKMLRVARRFNPDLFVGFSPIRASHCSRILRKKTIGIVSILD